MLLTQVYLEIFLVVIRDKIVFTVQGKLQELILREDKLSLDKAI
jgi:hypothetical protein